MIKQAKSIALALGAVIAFTETAFANGDGGPDASADEVRSANELRNANGDREADASTRADIGNIFMQGTWYAGIQQNLTGFAIEEDDESERDYGGLANTTLFLGHDFNLAPWAPNVALGTEIGIGLAHSSSNATDGDDQRNSSFAISRRISGEYSARVRAGYIMDELLNESFAYGTLGYHSLAIEGIIDGDEPGTGNDSNTSKFGKAGDKNVSGATYGVGIEFGLTGDFGVRLEYTSGAFNRLSLGAAYQF